MSKKNDSLKSVDEKTGLAGSNRLELLLFRLDDSEDIFGINVFKVREVLRTPNISKVPRSDERILGVISLRDQTMSLIDLPFSLGRSLKPCEEPDEKLVIITEYNQSTQGFLIHKVDRILHKSWTDIETPPNGSGKSSINALTRDDKNNIVQILDVETLLNDITGNEISITESNEDKKKERKDLPMVLCAEDSKIAQKFLRKILDGIGIPYRIFENGLEAWSYIKEKKEKPLALITDLEMPEMDGYTLIKKTREELKWNDLPIIVNSSMSGDFNKNLTDKVGADHFLPKWDEKLYELIIKIIEDYQQKNN